MLAERVATLKADFGVVVAGVSFILSPSLSVLSSDPDTTRRPVREMATPIDLRRSQIITKAQWTPQRTLPECPSSVATHSPVATSHTLSVLSHEPDTTRRPSGEIATPRTYDEGTSSQKYSGRRNAQNFECPSSVATHLPVATSQTLSVTSKSQTRRAARPGTRQRHSTYDEARSSQKYSGRRNARSLRVPFQRRHAFAGRHVPDLERVVVRPRHDAPPVRKHGNAQKTYDEARSSQKYSGRRATHAIRPSALSASPRIRRSRCPRP